MTRKYSEAVIEAASGAVGSVLALLATYPLKTIYTLQALSAGDDRSRAALTVLDIIQKYKLQGLYVGIEPNIIESGISSGVYFYLYSRLRAFAVSSRQARPLKSQLPASASTKHHDIGVLASLLVAGIAGAGNQLVTLPASVVATRMQSQQKLRVETKDPKVHTGALPVIRDIWSEGGLGAFWTGLLPALVLVVNPAVQYMLYEQILRLLRRWKQYRRLARQQQPGNVDSQEATPTPEQTECPVSLSSGEIFLASAVAKIGATVVTYPMIVIKSRVQASSKSVASQMRYNGTFQAISQTYQDEGMAGFFKGLRAKILQTALNAALMLMLKEQCYTATRAALSRIDNTESTDGLDGC